MKRLCYILVFFFALFSGQSIRAQNYMATKLELFPDRENVFVEDLGIDSKGFIWFLSKGKIYRFNGYKSLGFMETLSFDKRINGVFTTILIDKNDNLWASTSNHLYRFDLNRWEFVENPVKLLSEKYHPEIIGIKESPKGYILVGYNDGHIAVIKNGSPTIISDLYLRGATLNTKSIEWNCVFWNGRVWFLDTSKSLYSIDLDKNKFTTHQFRSLASGIEQIIPDEDHLLLIDTEHSILYRTDFNNFDQSLVVKDRLKNIGLETVLSKKWDYLLNQKKEGRLKTQIGKSLGQKAFLSSFLSKNAVVDINSMEVLGEDLIIATSGGIWAVHKKTKGLSSLIPMNDQNKSVRGLYQFKNGSIFFCGYGGAEYIKADGEKIQFNDFRSGYSILPLDEDYILIGLQGGFAAVFDRNKLRFKNFNFSIHESQRELPPPKYVLSMVQDASYIYFGTYNSLWRFNKKTKILKSLLGKVEKETALKARMQINHISLQKKGVLLSTNLGLMELTDGALKKIFAKNNKLWINEHIVFQDTIWLATQGHGLIAIDKKGNKLRTLDKTNGLSGNIIYSLTLANGYLVVGTGHGLSIIKKGKIKRLDRKDGLVNNEFNYNAAFYSPETKMLYMGGLKGYSVLDMGRDWFHTKSSPKNYITAISVTETERSIVKNNYSQPYKPKQSIELKPGQNLLKTSIGTPKSYKASQRLQYKVKGLVEAWQALPSENQITLMGFAPGDYKLIIKNMSETEKSALLQLDIIKLPAFHQTWTLKISVFLLLLFFGWLWNRSRLQKVKKEQVLRNKISADLHDEVGGLLTGITMQAEYLTISGKNASKNSTLKKIVSSSNDAVQAMSDIVWSIDSRGDNWESLLAKLREYSNNLYETSPTKLTFKTVGDPANKLNQKERLVIYRIFKEALNNSCKHARANTVKVLIKFLPAQVLLQIEDDGKGLPEIDKAFSRQGIKNMKARAKSIHAHFELKSDQKGVRIILLTKKRRKNHPFG